MRLYFGGGRKFRLHAGDDRVHALQRKNHVAAPVKEQIDLGIASAGDRSDFLKARYAVYGFFERPRDGHEHLVNRHDAVVNANDDARKIRVGKNGDRDAESKISANKRKRDDQEKNGSREAMEPRHGLFLGFALWTQRFRPG